MDAPNADGNPQLQPSGDATNPVSDVRSSPEQSQRMAQGDLSGHSDAASFAPSTVHYSRDTGATTGVPVHLQHRAPLPRNVVNSQYPPLQPVFHALYRSPNYGMQEQGYAVYSHPQNYGLYNNPLAYPLYTFPRYPYYPAPNAAHPAVGSQFVPLFATSGGPVRQNPEGHHISNEEQERITRDRNLQGLRRLLNTGPVDPKLLTQKAESKLLRKLLTEDSLVVDNVLRGVLLSPSVHDLMEDPYASSVLVDLMDVGNGDHKEQLVLAVTENASRLAKVAETRSGSHCIRSMIKKVKNNPAHSHMVANALAAVVCHVMRASKGFKILYHCFEYFDYEHTCLVIEAMDGHILELAKHSEGRWSVNCCIIHAKDLQKQQIMSTVARHCVELAMDDYGTDVVQYAMDFASPDIRYEIVDRVERRISMVSMSSGGSLFLLRLLMDFTCEQRFCHKIQSLEPQELEQILRHPSGSRVIECALERCQGSEIYRLLLRAIAKLPASLKDDPYAGSLYHSALHDLNEDADE